ncbi:MAG: hypothetical protein IJ561_01505 [Ruminococcus sp.]|nr:hypothetical protein [Ruminococcus sp.]
MAKKILQIFLVIIFVILLVIGIVVGTYVFSTPNTDKGSESRLLITGAWISRSDDRQLEFDENGNFKFSKLESEEVIADGYYRIDEDRNVVKLFILPGHHTDDFNDYMRLYFFAQISYSDLVDNGKEKDEEYTESQAPKCKFLIKNQNGGDGSVYEMIMPKKTLDLYSKGKKFEAKNK